MFLWKFQILEKYSICFLNIKRWSDELSYETLFVESCYTANHLFHCLCNPTELDVQDLWLRPDQVARFVSSLPSFGYLPPLPPPSPEPVPTGPASWSRTPNPSRREQTDGCWLGVRQQQHPPLTEVSFCLLLWLAGTTVNVFFPPQQWASSWKFQLNFWITHTDLNKKTGLEL